MSEMPTPSPVTQSEGSATENLQARANKFGSQPGEIARVWEDVSKGDISEMSRTKVVAGQSCKGS